MERRDVREDNSLMLVRYEKVLEILKNQRGNMHSDVAVALDNLAKLYLCVKISQHFSSFPTSPFSPLLHLLTLLIYALDTKTLGKAELYFKEALAIKTEALGDDHAFTAITQDHLAQLLSRCSRYEEAEELYQTKSNPNQTNPKSCLT